MSSLVKEREKEIEKLAHMISVFGVPLVSE